MKELTTDEIFAAIASAKTPRHGGTYTEEQQGYIELGAWRFLEYLKANGLIAT